MVLGLGLWASSILVLEECSFVVVVIGRRRGGMLERLVGRYLQL
jgi:hypothetical protein